MEFFSSLKEDKRAYCIQNRKLRNKNNRNKMHGCHYTHLDYVNLVLSKNFRRQVVLKKILINQKKNRILQNFLFVILLYLWINIRKKCFTKWKMSIFKYNFVKLIWLKAKQQLGHPPMKIYELLLNTSRLHRKLHIINMILLEELHPQGLRAQ